MVHTMRYDNFDNNERYTYMSLLREEILETMRTCGEVDYSSVLDGTITLDDIKERIRNLEPKPSPRNYLTIDMNMPIKDDFYVFFWQTALLQKNDGRREFETQLLYRCLKNGKWEPYFPTYFFDDCEQTIAHLDGALAGDITSFEDYEWYDAYDDVFYPEKMNAEVRLETGRLSWGMDKEKVCDYCDALKYVADFRYPRHHYHGTKRTFAVLDNYGEFTMQFAEHVKKPDIACELLEGLVYDHSDRFDLAKSRAQSYLADIYMEKGDFRGAYALYDAAMKDGDIHALIKIAEMYKYGQYLDKDYDKYKELILQAEVNAQEQFWVDIVNTYYDGKRPRNIKELWQIWADVVEIYYADGKIQETKQRCIDYRKRLLNVAGDVFDVARRISDIYYKVEKKENIDVCVWDGERILRDKGHVTLLYRDKMYHLEQKTDRGMKSVLCNGESYRDYREVLLNVEKGRFIESMNRIEIQEDVQ